MSQEPNNSGNVNPDIEQDSEQDLPEQIAVRLAKRERLNEIGDAYPVSLPITHTIDGVREAYPNLEIDTATGDKVALAGRIVALEHGDQGMLAKAFVTHQNSQSRLLGRQLLLILVFIQPLGHVQAVEQAAVIQAGGQRCHMRLHRPPCLGLKRRLQAVEQRCDHRRRLPHRHGRRA